MKAIIMGCGRAGSQLAITLDRDGHDVTILDINAYQFTRFLPESFGGHTITGNGIDQDVLRRAGIEEADAFVAVTAGDNRNVMAAQIARHIFGVERVVCRIYDPIREQMYHRLGLRTISPTREWARLLKEALEAEETQPVASHEGGGQMGAAP
ncbi:MAG: potassium transporter TrkA [Chloroflexi bacterium RBG_16_68_14]|nr:MAG: potassium transporter TrkA [Chloroflexi bacterium RBG_16_68_14]